MRAPPRSVDAVMLDQRAASFTRRSIKAASKRQGLRMAISMLDLTTLEGADSPQKIRSLAAKAVHPMGARAAPGGEPLPSAAAVCVYPALVSVAKAAVAGSSVRVASVATAFPSGQSPLEVRLAEVRAAVDAGADEIDMVINRGAFHAGRYDEVAAEIRAVREACRPAHLKIILETGELGSCDRVRFASDLAIAAAAEAGPNEDGEVFIKTSTGKVSPAATLPVTLVMLESIRDHFLRTGVRIGMKPAGGIRDAKTALHYLAMVKETLGEAWLSPRLFRFGASSLLNDLLRQLVRLDGGVYPATSDFADA